MEIVRIKIYTTFRGLKPPFEINFRSNSDRNEIDPVCFAGLNGSGKSNVMELISEIFFYLEAIHNLSAQKYVKNNSPFGFYIEYRIPITANNLLAGEPASYIVDGLQRSVFIDKKKDKGPVISYQVEDNERITLESESVHEEEYLEVYDKLLPSKIVAYSSGGNEQISKPFRRMGFFYFDEFERATHNAEHLGNTRLNRLYFMDYRSNAAVLLANFLFKDNILNPGLENDELDYMKQIVDIQDIRSFQITFNLNIKRNYSYQRLKERMEEFSESSEVEQLLESFRSLFFQKVDIPVQLQTFVTDLIHCSTTQHFVFENSSSDPVEGGWIRLTLYFQVDPELKRAFQETFAAERITGFFQNLYLLELLNLYNYSEELREEAKKAGLGKNLSELLPEIIQEDKVFYINEVYLVKRSDGSRVLYKNLSDGEHQFIQILGALLLMEEEGVIFILDEPSTHFNATWSAKFFSTLNDIYLKRIERVQDKHQRRQNVIISTHSPIMLSDCKSKNVIWFEREEGKTLTKKLDFETYGASVDYIMKRLGDTNVLIPDRARKELEQAIQSEDINEVRKAILEFGESSEKQFLFGKLHELKKSQEE